MSPSAVIVAHGQPSDPLPPEAEMHALAARVGGHLPGWEIRAATLAAPDALRVALRGLEAPAVFPFFMADGWFIRTLLPRGVAPASPSCAICTRRVCAPARGMAARFLLASPLSCPAGPWGRGRTGGHGRAIGGLARRDSA